MKPLAAGLIALALPAHAATLVTGAAVGEGISLNPADVVYALNITGVPTPNFTGPFQGVTFQANVSEITVGSGAWGFFSGADSSFNGGSAAEQALNDLGKELFFSGVNGSLVIADLVPGASYKLDLLQAIGGFSSRSQEILVNGVVVDTVTLTQNSGEIWNTAVTGVADTNGEILLGFNRLTGDGPVFSTLIVSVPEPSSALLGAFGLLALLRRRV